MATILGTSGNDTLAANAAGDLVQGRAGDDLLTTDLNDTALEGGNGMDELIATANAVVSAPGSELTVAQTIDGGNNFDTISFDGTLELADGSDGSEAILISFASGGAGRDTITVDSTVTAVSVSSAVAGTVIDGGDSNDAIDVDIAVSSAGEAGAFAFIESGSGADIITVDASATSTQPESSDVLLSIDTGRGSDSLSAFVTASGVSAGIFAGTGNDQVILNISGDGAGSTADVFIAGGGGNDTVVVGFGAGVDGAAELLGEGGADLLAVSGGSGSTLAGGAGSDLLTGSAAGDTFLFREETTDGLIHRDEITNYSKAAGDVIALAGGVDAVASWSVVAGSTRLVLEGADGLSEDQIILRNVIIASLNDVTFEDTPLIG